jgi:hypothetical protein
MRARMYSAPGITEQGFGSGDACRVPWANETTTATTQSWSRRNRPPDARKDHPKLVQERLGHATIAITLDTYSHYLPSMGDQAAGAMGGALG